MRLLGMSRWLRDPQFRGGPIFETLRIDARRGHGLASSRVRSADARQRARQRDQQQQRHGVISTVAVAPRGHIRTGQRRPADHSEVAFVIPDNDAGSGTHGCPEARRRVVARRTRARPAVRYPEWANETQERIVWMLLTLVAIVAGPLRLLCAGRHTQIPPRPLRRLVHRRCRWRARRRPLRRRALRGMSARDGTQQDSATAAMLFAVVRQWQDG